MSQFKEKICLNFGKHYVAFLEKIMLIYRNRTFQQPKESRTQSLLLIYPFFFFNAQTKKT
jgi:hypothetical protein